MPRVAEGLVVHCGRPDRGPLRIRARLGLAPAWPFVVWGWRAWIGWLVVLALGGIALGLARVRRW